MWNLVEKNWIIAILCQHKSLPLQLLFSRENSFFHSFLKLFNNLLQFQITNAKVQYVVGKMAELYKLVLIGSNLNVLTYQKAAPTHLNNSAK